MTTKKGIVWGALGRGAPGSWLLLRAKDGRILAASETCGGALKSAHAMWPDLDASDRDADGVRILRDADGGVVGAATPKDHADRVREALSALQRIERPNAQPEVIRTVENDNSQKTSRARRAPTNAPANTASSKAKAAKATAATTIHIVAPASLRAQVEALRAQIETATTIRPTTTDVVKRALELGLAAMSAKLTTPNT